MNTSTGTKQSCRKSSLPLKYQFLKTANVKKNVVNIWKHHWMWFHAFGSESIFRICVFRHITGCLRDICVNLVYLLILSTLAPLASLVAQRIKHLPAMQETRVQPQGWEDPLEKETAIHSSILAWRIPWTEEPGRLQSMGSQRVRHD